MLLFSFFSSYFGSFSLLLLGVKGIVPPQKNSSSTHHYVDGGGGWSVWKKKHNMPPYCSCGVIQVSISPEIQILLGMERQLDFTNSHLAQFWSPPTPAYVPSSRRLHCLHQLLATLVFLLFGAGHVQVVHSEFFI